jgi:NADH-quinone oxidoreductase subunit M
MVALVQKDFKFVIGYSSVSHMGFVMLGLVTLTTIGLSGAVLQMFSHGIIAGLLFGVVGRMVYDRAHTRVLDELEPMRLNRVMPFAAFTFVVGGLASMGMPGFSGFIAELQVLLGAWKAFPTYAILAGLGLLIGVAYTLRAIQKAFFAAGPEELPVAMAGSFGASAESVAVAAGLPPLAVHAVAVASESGAGTTPHSGAGARADSAPEPAHEQDPISTPERVGAALLMATTLVVGLYPRLLLDWIVPAVQSPLFENVLKGGGR